MSSQPPDQHSAAAAAAAGDGGDQLILAGRSFSESEPEVEPAAEPEPAAEGHDDEPEQPAAAVAAAAADLMAFAGIKSFPPKEGATMPYVTLVPTSPQPSTIEGAGTGLMTVAALQQFDWIGFYPGKVTRRVNKKLLDHTMGLDVAGATCGGEAKATKKGKGPLFLVPDPEVPRGLHMINEPPPGRDVNVWYVKLENGFVLFFAGKAIAAGDELLTCYSRSYPKRAYGISRKGCTDPRCANQKLHRTHSQMLPEWRAPLRKSRPAGIGSTFLKAAGLGKPKKKKDS